MSRNFDTGANRDDAEHKPDFEAYLSVPALRAYGRYMLKHSVLPDGSRRSGDNWRLGMPCDQYRKSLIRHVFDVLDMGRGMPVYDYDGSIVSYEDALCAVLFNVFGLLDQLEVHGNV